MEHKNPALAVDCVVFNEAGELLLIQRKNDPFKGMYALPGGFVDYGESTEAAALRELQEETGVKATEAKLIGVYSDPNRDPRGHVVSAAYLIEFPSGAEVQAGDDAATVQFVKEWKSLEFAFDHRDIIRGAVKLYGR